MCFLSSLQLHVPLVAPSSPSQCVHNPFEVCKCCITAACMLANLQVTSHMHLLLFDVLLFHLSHLSHLCGLCVCWLVFWAGQLYTVG